MAMNCCCIYLRSKRALLVPTLATLLTACGAGQPGDSGKLDLESISLNGVASASVDETNAPVVRISDSNTTDSETAVPQLGAAAALPEQAQELQQINTVAEASSATNEGGAGIDLPTAVEEVVNASATAVDQAPQAITPAVTDNETFSENEAEEGADSVSILGCVGNLAWSDINADGKRTTNEPGMAIDLIELISPDGDVVDSTSTTSGYYQLCSLPGTHTIRFAMPDGYKVTIKDAGSSDTADSDADEDGLVIADVQASKNKSKYDIGFVPMSVSLGAANEENAPTVVLVEENATGQTPPLQPEPPVVEPSVDNNVVQNGSDVSDLRWGFWTETRNAYDSPLGNSDEGVETIFENYTFAHVKAMSLARVSGNTQSKDYVVNVLEKATQTNTVLDLQLGSAGEYGWNFSTGRGNFNLTRWKESIANFSATADPVAHAAIVQALQNGTIRYIFLIDEPNHKRWSPSWDGSHGSSAPGDPNYVSNQDLDEMAAAVKATFGDDTKTIVRTSAVNLITGSRRGMYVFEHMTHAYLTISSTKWIDGANKGPNKGFEWFLNIKNNHTDNTTNLTAFRAANIKPSIMIQAGFESSGNPWTGSKNFKSQWWQGDIRYPYNGATGYVKTAPGEMDFWIKSLLSPRDPITGVLSDTGVRWFEEFVIFRADRLPTDAGRLPFSTYPHYGEFLEQLKLDLSNNNLNPVIGIPVDWNGD